MTTLRLVRLVIVVFVWLAVAPAGWAQEQPAEPPAADAPPPFREQTIYIPFNRLREVFERARELIDLT